VFKKYDFPINTKYENHNSEYSEKLKRQGQCNVLITRSFIADVYKAALAKDIIFLDLAKAKGLL
jgi:hypothetical protein